MKCCGCPGLPATPPAMISVPPGGVPTRSNLPFMGLDSRLNGLLARVGIRYPGSMCSPLPPAPGNLQDEARRAIPAGSFSSFLHRSAWPALSREALFFQTGVLGRSRPECY
jgi:hypothetical protein